MRLDPENDRDFFKRYGTGAWTVINQETHECVRGCELADSKTGEYRVKGVSKQALKIQIDVDSRIVFITPLPEPLRGGSGY